ncbi:MAG: ExbD/TolR family protein [Pseudomonadota bacterium]
MLQYRRRRRRLSDMNVVPYIDVMLVLLIIFMITSPLLNRSVEVELPSVTQAETVVPEQQTKFVIVTVDAQGRVFLDEDEQSLTMETLRARVTALPQNSQVLVKGDNRAAYGTVVEIVSLLQKAGVEKVGLLTNPLDN